MKKYFTPWNLFIVCMVALWTLVIYGAMQPYEARDDSDGPHENSRMEVFTDHLTGCQYLYRYSLVPRMDANGKQVCKKVN